MVLSSWKSAEELKLFLNGILQLVWVMAYLQKEDLVPQTVKS